MSKNQFIKTFALLALAAAAMSCAKEQTAGQAAGVSFSVETPTGITTRAEAGDGSAATKLYYQAFNSDGTVIEGLGVQSKDLENGRTTVNFQLVKDRTYKFIFWAQTPDTGYYTIDKTAGLKKITADYSTNKLANDEKRDAFFAVKTVTVSGAQAETVELRRPFAQLNIATLGTIKAGETATSIDFTGATSTVTVSALPTVFTPMEGTSDIGSGQDVTFEYAGIPAGDITVNGTAYKYLAMNYILAPVDGTVYDITAEFTVEGKQVKLNAPGVPVKRNYRTNIIGNLLTGNADFNVVVNPGFEGDDNQHPILVNGVAYKTLDAAVTAVPAGKQTIIKLEQDIAGNGISTTDGQDIVIDLGGHTFDIDGTTVGSAGSPTNGLQLLKGSKVTLKNGTIKSKKAYILIQNYCDLTLENVTLDASESVGTKEGSYVISNNHGTVKILGTTSILAPAGKVAFDVYYWAPAYKDGVNVYVNTTGTISGAIEYGCSTGSEAASKTLSSLVIDNAVLKNSSFKTTLANPNVKIACGVFADESAVNAWIPTGYNAVKVGNYYIITKDGEPISVSVSGQDELDQILANIPAGGKAEISLEEGTYTLPETVNADGVTISGKTGTEVIDCAATTTVSAKNATITNVVVKGSGAFTDGSSLAISGANSTVKGCKFQNGRQNTYGSDLAVSQTAIISDCDFRKSGFRGIMIWNTGDEVKIDNCLFDNTYPFNCDGGTGKITVTNSDLKGWTSYTSGLELVSFTNCAFGKSASGYAYLIPYSKTIVKDCTFSFDFCVSPSGSEVFTIEFVNCKYVDGTPVTSAIMDNDADNRKVSWIIDDTTYNY